VLSSVLPVRDSLFLSISPRLDAFISLSSLPPCSCVLQDRSSPTHDRSRVVSPTLLLASSVPGFSVHITDPAARDRVRPSIATLSFSPLRPRLPFWDCDPPLDHPARTKPYKMSNEESNPISPRFTATAILTINALAALCGPWQVGIVRVGGKSRSDFEQSLGRLLKA
jgi:hypothetical protein